MITKKEFKSVDDLLKLTKGNNKYQLFIISSLFVVGFVSDFVFNQLPFMESLPVVNYEKGGKIIQTDLNYTICDNEDYSINLEETKTYSWIYEFDFYCNKFLIGFLGWVIVGGSFIGTLCSQMSNYFGTRIIMISGGFILSFGCAILLFETLPALFIANFMMGVSNGFIFMTKNIIMTEISDAKTRSYFLGISLGGSSIVTVLAYAMVDNNINWRIYYYTLAAICLAVTICYLLFSVENPRFYGVCKDYEKFRASVIYIKNFNNPELILPNKNINDHAKNTQEKDDGEPQDCNKSDQKQNQADNTLNSNIEKESHKDKNEENSIHNISTNDSSIVLKTLTNEEFECCIEQVFLHVALRDPDIGTEEENVTDTENSEEETTEKIKIVEERKNSTQEENSIKDSFNNNRYSNTNEEPLIQDKSQSKQTSLLVEKKEKDKLEVLSMKDSMKKTSLCQRFCLFIKVSLSKINTKIFYIFAIMTTLEESYQYLIGLEIKQYNNDMSIFYYIFAAVNLVSIILVTKIMNIKSIGRKGTLYIITAGILVTTVTKKLYEIFSDDENTTLLIALYLIKRNFVWNLLCPVHTFANESFNSKNRVLLYGLGYSLAKGITQIMPFVYEYGSEYLEYIGWGVSIILAITVFNTKETVGKQLKDA